jgi:hypothetical protein
MDNTTNTSLEFWKKMHLCLSANSNKNYKRVTVKDGVVWHLDKNIVARFSDDGSADNILIQAGFKLDPHQLPYYITYTA